MTAQFTDPAPPPAAPAQRKLYNQWGQYLLPDPETGKERAWVRATTLAKALEDTYNLEMWSNRMVAKGMALRPDLLALAASLDVEVDKKRLNGVAKDAKEAAGGSSGANMGTALHAMTEKIDAGQDVNPGPFAAELAAYRRTMAQEGIVVLPHYSERIICVPELGVAGRLDKLAEYAGQPGPYQVMDLKSQKSMDFGGLSIAIQLSLYAHAYAMWDPATESWEDPPPIDQVMATVIWLPVVRDPEPGSRSSQAGCLVYDVDILQGWEWAKLCTEVRAIRKVNPVTIRQSWEPGPALSTVQGIMAAAGPDSELPPPGSLERFRSQEVKDLLPVIQLSRWEGLFHEAETVEELASLGHQAAADYGGALPTELKNLGRELRAQLSSTSP